MIPTLISVRNAVYEQIEVCASSMVITDFDLIKTYYPKTELQTISKPRVFVVAMQWAEDKLARSSAREMDLPIQIAVQAKVNPTDTESIDLLICFVEELNRLCAKLERQHITWIRTQPMQDPNGTPLGFLELHEQHLFQSTFTAFYKTAVC